MESAVEELMPRLLPVGDCDLPDDFDPTVPPRTPQEYLRRVQIEAARCPDVVVAQIDPKKLRKKQTVNIACLPQLSTSASRTRTINSIQDKNTLLFINREIKAEQISGCQPAPEGYSPTLEWQQQQVANFSSVRQEIVMETNLSYMASLSEEMLWEGTPDVFRDSSLNKHRNHWRSQDLDSNVNMPKLEDEEGWKKFCLGERVYSEIDAEPDDENVGIDYIKVGFPPLLSIVSRMNQATVTSVLEYLISWFAEKKFTPELGRWFYALLACLEKPLLPEAHSLIRQLARQCSEVRVLEENKSEEQVSALNLLICLVSRYFDQRDLADEPS